MTTEHAHPEHTSASWKRWIAPAAVAAVVVGGCAFVWIADPTTPGGMSPPCPFKMLTGWDCPGCGASRMVYSLLHLDVLGALRFNAVAVLGLILLGLSYVRWIRQLATGVQRRGWEHYRWSPAIVLAVAIVWLVIRNLPWAPFTSLYV